MTHVELCNNRLEWDKQINDRRGHPLQLWGWGEVKALHGWQAVRLLIKKDSLVIGHAQLLAKKLPIPFGTIVYVPRGPLCEKPYRDEVLSAIANYAKTALRALLVTIEPDWEGKFDSKGWRSSKNTILIPRTLILDLRQSAEQLLGAMAGRTRYDIRKAEKEQALVKEVISKKDLIPCLAIYKDTAKRAGFALHEDQYYIDIFTHMGKAAPLFAVYSRGKPVAFTWLAQTQGVAFELYGGMTDEARKIRANYTLKWHIIQEMKNRGVLRYDVNGLLNDRISLFKQGFASHENMLVGTYDRPLSWLYPLWNNGLPVLKKIMRYFK